jgi:hypothetical protein
MPIEFACGCGRRLRVTDEHAGKLARCPACRGVAQVPALQPAKSDPGFAAGSPARKPAENPAAEDAAEEVGLELVEEDDSEHDEEVDLEVVEEGTPPPADDYWELEEVKGSPPAGKTADASTPPDAPAGGAGAKGERPRKKRKKSPPEREKGMAGAYMSAARSQMEMEDKERNRLRRARGNGLTFLNVHVTAGVVGGASMLVSGLVCLAVLGICLANNIMIYNPRIVIGAVVYTAIGAFTLVRALVFGQED